MVDIDFYIYFIQIHQKDEKHNIKEALKNLKRHQQQQDINNMSQANTNTNPMFASASLQALKRRFIAEAASMNVTLEQSSNFRKLSPYRTCAGIDILFYAKSKRVAIYYDRRVQQDSEKHMSIMHIMPSTFSSTICEMRDEYDGSVYHVERLKASGKADEMLKAMVELFELLGRV